MKALQKFGGFAAFYLAAAFLLGLTLFVVVLDYASITDPLQKVALLAEKHSIIFLTNLLMYVFFGVFLVVLATALYERFKSGSPILAKVATILGVIWAGSLVASGMVSNAGIDPVLALYAIDPGQASLIWQMIESISSGLGNGNGEILGGCWVLLTSVAALRGGGLPKALNFLGLAVGAIGILSLIPGLISTLTSLFGVTQVIWYVWLGVVLLRNKPVKAG